MLFESMKKEVYSHSRSYSLLVEIVSIVLLPDGPAALPRTVGRRAEPLTLERRTV